MKLAFKVFGRPEPQGSTRAFVPKGWTRPVVTSTNPKLKAWRQELAQAAASATFDSTDHYPIPAGQPVAAVLRLFYAPPKNKQKYLHKSTRPDADKALRACLDGLSGIVYADDSQVAKVTLEKFFGMPERAEIEIESIEPEGLF